MKKLPLVVVTLCVLAQTLFFGGLVHAQTPPIISPPIACKGGGCPPELSAIYNGKGTGESCVATYDEFKQAPELLHFWAEDPDITAQGKADERARQFISWVLGRNAIDDHPALKSIWGISRSIALFLVVLVVPILGLGFIVGQRANFNLKIKIWPTVLKIGGALLYIAFSATIVLFLVQLSEILMRFFIENLGADKLFNIYFADTKSLEKNYTEWIGCRDLNIRVQESAHTELFLLKLTNITYYIMGTMLLLRKILLWFLLFVSPFLAILFPFVLIRNIGWIWIGVFFQWLFYGPLFALFLGALAKIWREGIPFIFDFHRANTPDGYIYPTATNLVFGGPAQRLTILNSGNYIDTFVEYVITLIMLWAVIFFPWWLLRIFRDYCCDGIYAVKNILLSMYDQTRNPPSPSPTPIAPVTPIRTGAAISTPQRVEIPVTTRLETIEEIRKTRTEDITKSLHLSATKLTDIARFETNKQTQENVKKNLDYLSNPTKAQTPTERQKYMNIRTELFSRAIKEDTIAKQLLSVTAQSSVEKTQFRSKLLTTTPTAQQVSQAVSASVKLPAEKVTSITNAVTNSLSANQSLVNTIAQNTQVTAPQVQTILTSYKQKLQDSPLKVVDTIAQETGTQKEKVTAVMKQVSQVLKTNKEITAEVAQKENVKQEEVQKVIQAQLPMVAEPAKHVEQTISIPSSVSIEDYEEVKKMWIQQYEKGEVPVTENISTRDEWIDQDTVFITNTLNKLLSTEEKVKLEGLDEVGYILPMFMINNLKGEELLVYLKAKLEAAKYVEEQLTREKEITEKLKAKSEEVLIDVPQTKKDEQAKTMSLEESLPLEGEKSEATPTDLGSEDHVATINDDKK